MVFHYHFCFSKKLLSTKHSRFCILTQMVFFMIKKNCLDTCSRTHRSFGITPTFSEHNLCNNPSQIIQNQCHTKRRTGLAKCAQHTYLIMLILLSEPCSSTLQHEPLSYTYSCLNHGWHIS